MKNRRKILRVEQEFSDKVYTILVEKGGAQENMREPFINYYVDETFDYHEWRFGGKLGFGGKYRKYRNAVDCYQEDETPEINKLIEEINKDLLNLKTSGAKADG